MHHHKTKHQRQGPPAISVFDPESLKHFILFFTGDSEKNEIGFIPKLLSDAKKLLILDHNLTQYDRAILDGLIEANQSVCDQLQEKLKTTLKTVSIFTFKSKFNDLFDDLSKTLSTNIFPYLHALLYSLTNQGIMDQRDAESAIANTLERIKNLSTKEHRIETTTRVESILNLFINEVASAKDNSGVYKPFNATTNFYTHGLTRFYKAVDHALLDHNPALKKSLRQHIEASVRRFEQTHAADQVNTEALDRALHKAKIDIDCLQSNILPQLHEFIALVDGESPEDVLTLIESQSKNMPESRQSIQFKVLAEYLIQKDNKKEIVDEWSASLKHIIRALERKSKSYAAFLEDLEKNFVALAQTHPDGHLRSMLIGNIESHLLHAQHRLFFNLMDSVRQDRPQRN